MNKLLNFLGLCRRSGKISMGHEAVNESIKKKQSKLILFASDIASRTKSDVLYTIEEHKVSFADIESTKEEISQILGKHIAVISINDENMAKKIKSILSNEDK